MERTIFLKLLAALLFSFSVSPAFSGEGKITKDCAFKGFKLYGKIQIVEHFPDIKVQVVEHFPDLKVKWVNHFPDSCGKWKQVEHFPDLKIQFVQNFPDLKIKFEENFPGLP